MLSAIICGGIGVLIGWFAPRPKFVQDYQDKNLY